MNKRLWITLAVAGIMHFVLAPAAFANPGRTPEPATLVDTVRQATAGYKDVAAAQAAGYSLFHGCVSGPQGGAMGVHFVNGDVVGDGELDAAHPEALLYEAEGWQNAPVRRGISSSSPRPGTPITTCRRC